MRRLALALVIGCHDPVEPLREARPVVSVVLPEAGAPEAAAPQAAAPRSGWCIDELEELEGATCAYVPEAAKSLVIYLHGTIPPEGGEQRKHVMDVVLASAKRRGYAAILPRGKRGLGPNKIPEWWSWPTTAPHHAAHARDMVASWLATRAAIEERRGRPFEKTYLAGSSNGAYFLTVLAMRGEIAVDGFGAMSGGNSGGRAAEGLPETKAPFYVGWGAHDETKDMPRSLVELLKLAKWPHLAREHPVGHGAKEVYLDEAFDFWEGKSSRWCAGELEQTKDETCIMHGMRGVLVFLHGVIEPGAGTQHAQQRAAAKAASAHGLAAIMPKGKQGIAPSAIESWWAWPTSAPHHATHARAMMAAWEAAMPRGKRFYVGYSSGAFFLSTLVLKGELAADGVGLLAGGSAVHGELGKARPPIFIGYGKSDDGAYPMALASQLAELRWPHKVDVHSGSHGLEAEHIQAAITYMLAP